MKTTSNWIVEAVIVAMGLGLLGWCVKGGIDDFANRGRKVTVKGLAVMEVPANLVTWPIVTKQTGNDLVKLYADINRTNTAISNFLKQNGIPATDVTVDAPEVTDTWANQYSSSRPADRYLITSVVMVTSKQVDKVRTAISKQGQLLNQGIAIVNDDYDNNISYDYTGFSDIKPKMMDEAIENAKATAEQFAQKSGSELGKIETAGQGQFEIDDRDEHTPWVKQLRVVTTVTYSLKD